MIQGIVCLGRLLTGHSAGSHLVSSPIFVSEISHPDIRGATSNLTMILYTSGKPHHYDLQ